MNQPANSSPNDTYSSPLADRYASREMLEIWSPRRKFQTWRKIWLAVAEAQHEMGLPVSREQVEELRANLEVTDEDIALAREYEGKLRHDVMSHVHAWGDKCPTARGIIHLGMTSQDINCNTELLQIQHASAAIDRGLDRLMVALGSLADRYAKVPTLGFTHYQPAQPTTVGRRFAQFAHDLNLTRQLSPDDIRPRGIRGAVGTQASFKTFETNPSRDPEILHSWYRWIFDWQIELQSKPNYLEQRTIYLYTQTAKRLVRDLWRLDKLDVLDSPDQDIHGWSLMKLVDWIDQYEWSSLQSYESRINRFLSAIDEQAPKQKPAKIPPNEWEVAEELVVSRLGFSAEPYRLTGQTYPRVFDAQVVSHLAATASVLHKIATDIRLLSNRKEIDEPFAKNQIGSSAMPYKRNPMRCERVCAIARYVWNLVPNTYDTAATQWLERTLDDSANRRMVLPEAFLGLDACLNIMHNVISGLIVNEAMVRKNLMDELPFLATESMMMEAVKLGRDRQDVHEAIRLHSIEAGKRIKGEGKDNDLVERLKKEPLLDGVDIDAHMDPMRHVGLAVEQTERFLREVIDPIRDQLGDDDTEASDLSL